MRLTVDSEAGGLCGPGGMVARGGGVMQTLDTVWVGEVGGVPFHFLGMWIGFPVFGLMGSGVGRTGTHSNCPTSVADPATTSGDGLERAARLITLRLWTTFPSLSGVAPTVPSFDLFSGVDFTVHSFALLSGVVSTVPSFTLLPALPPTVPSFAFLSVLVCTVPSFSCINGRGIGVDVLGGCVCVLFLGVPVKCNSSSVGIDTAWRGLCDVLVTGESFAADASAACEPDVCLVALLLLAFADWLLSVLSGLAMPFSGDGVCGRECLGCVCCVLLVLYLLVEAGELGTLSSDVATDWGVDKGK